MKSIFQKIAESSGERNEEDSITLQMMSKNGNCIIPKSE